MDEDAWDRLLGKSREEPEKFERLPLVVNAALKLCKLDKLIDMTEDGEGGDPADAAGVIDKAAEVDEAVGDGPT